MLLDLSKLLINTSYEQMSVLFFNRSVGSIIGAIIGSLYIQFKPLYESLDPISICSILSILSSIMAYLIPFSNQLFLIQIYVTIATACFGFTEMTLQSIIIKTWGDERSAPIMQGFHMIFNLGSTVGPVLMSYFVSEKSSEACVLESDQDLAVDVVTQNMTLARAIADEANLIYVPFAFSSILIAISSIIFAYNGLKFKRLKIETIIHNQGLETIKIEEVEETDEFIGSGTTTTTTTTKNVRQRQEKFERKEKSFFKYRFWMLILVFFLYFGIGGSLHWYGDNIYQYAICSLGWEVINSTFLQSVFWGTCSISGLVGVYILGKVDNEKFGPKFYCFIDISLIVFTFLGLYFSVLYLSGTRTVTDHLNLFNIIIWTGNILLGIAYGTAYAAGISWVVNDYLDVTGIYFLVFVLGDFIGQMPLKFAGVIISEFSGEWFYLIEIFYVMLTLGMMLLMHFLGRFRW